VPRVNHASLAAYPVIIVGSGLFGLTIAQLVAMELNKHVLIVEKRSHPGGNSWSQTDSVTGIEFHTYGSHLFHTNNLRVWNFVNQFSEFTNYRHRVFAKHKDSFFSIPINLHTLSQFFGKAFSPDQARRYFEAFTNEDKVPPRNFAEAAISTIGLPLYQAFFESYTRKQWQTDPILLPAETFRRIPVRLLRRFVSRFA
jgi:UDP-galactopyranose mutase